MPASQLDNSAFLSLEPNMRAFALVGSFMGHFALLESGINSALEQILEIKGARSLIVMRNMQFDDKIKTLKSLVDFFVFDRNQAKAFSALANRCRDFGATRNVVAHTPFVASHTSDGVKFLVVSATSTLKTPEMDWSIDETLSQIDGILRLDRALRTIEQQMSLQRIAKALIESADQDFAKSKLGGLFGLGSPPYQVD